LIKHEEERGLYITMEENDFGFLDLSQATNEETEEQNGFDFGDDTLDDSEVPF